MFPEFCSLGLQHEWLLVRSLFRVFQVDGFEGFLDFFGLNSNFDIFQFFLNLFRLGRQDLAVIDPGLDADLSHDGVRLGQGVIDVGPGILIGRDGERVKNLRAKLEAITASRIQLNIIEIEQPETNAYLV